MSLCRISLGYLLSKLMLLKLNSIFHIDCVEVLENHARCQNLPTYGTFCEKDFLPLSKLALCPVWHIFSSFNYCTLISKTKFNFLLFNLTLSSFFLKITIGLNNQTKLEWFLKIFSVRLKKSFHFWSPIPCNLWHSNLSSF